jgi:DNA mismatch repair protein MutS
MSVAWATLEWICRKIKARTLFATHYHELTHLDQELPALANAHMAVEGSKDSRARDLRFLYELRPGPASESFGIQVARLAGLPQAVIDRAWQVLEVLEASNQKVERGLNINHGQLSLFEFGQNDSAASNPFSNAPQRLELDAEVLPHPLVTALDNIEINDLTPLQALNQLAELKALSLKSSDR